MANDPQSRESTGTRVARKRAPAKKAAPRKKAAAPTPPTAAPAVDPFTAPVAAQEEVPAVSEEKKTRTPDPLLAAKRRLEKAVKEQAKAQKKADAVQDVRTALDDANAELTAARADFQSAVENVYSTPVTINADDDADADDDGAAE